MFSAVRIEDYGSLALRPFMKKAVGKSRVSQNFFASLCDAKVSSLDDLPSVLPESTRSIYVQSDLLKAGLLEILPQSVRVIVVGNGDRDFTGPLELPPNIERVYLQNLLFRSDRTHILPIGVENLSLAKNGLPHLYAKQVTRKVRKVLVGPFGPTHPEREELLRISSSAASHIVTVQKRTTAWEYSRLSQRYEFIACPRGNGIDTHRFWETLYRGGIPIVKRSIWSELIEGLGLPLVQLDSWDALQHLDLEEEAIKHKENTRLALSPAFWSSLIQSH